MHTNLPGSWGATVTHMMDKMSLGQWAVRWCLSFCNLNVRIFYCLCVQRSSVSQTVVRDHCVSESQNEWMETTLKYIKQTCISIAWVKNLSAVMKKSVYTYKLWMYAIMLLMKVPWKLISTGMGSSREQHHAHLVLRAVSASVGFAIQSSFWKWENRALCTAGELGFLGVWVCIYLLFISITLSKYESTSQADVLMCLKDNWLSS